MGNRWREETIDERKQRFEKFIKKKDSPDDCWIWIGTINFRNGLRYGRFKIKSKNCVASRAAYELYIGPIPNGLNVCHKCDIGTCVNPSHLFLGTQKDNMQDAARKHRTKDQRGIKNSKAKLTNEQVIAIRQDNNHTLRQIAKNYNVSCHTIFSIKQRRTWVHVR